jgi:hypothetical protein
MHVGAPLEPAIVVRLVSVEIAEDDRDGWIRISDGLISFMKSISPGNRYAAALGAGMTFPVLCDIRWAFAEKGINQMPSADLVVALVPRADRPWGECNRSKVLTKTCLRGG